MLTDPPDFRDEIERRDLIAAVRKHVPNDSRHLLRIALRIQDFRIAPLARELQWSLERTAEAMRIIRWRARIAAGDFQGKC